jgi:hypothetical protein
VRALGITYQPPKGEIMKRYTPSQSFEYKIAKQFVSALINDDESGLTDDEGAQLWEWEQNLPTHYHLKAPMHKVFDVSPDEGEDFDQCEVCGLLADCATLTVNYI